MEYLYLGEAMTLLDGKKTSERILAQLKEKIAGMERAPRLEIILVGDNAASRKYVGMKMKTGEQIGVEVNLNEMIEAPATEDVVHYIGQLNSDPEVSGLMVQLPLPEGIDTPAVLESIDPAKDVDGLTATNLGLLYQRNPLAIAAATPRGVMSLLDEYGVEIEGKDVVIMGPTPVVGLPLAAMMLARGETVTVCHDKTPDVRAATSMADILVSAVGKGHFIKQDWVKEGAAIVDVGLSPDESGKLIGDVDFEDVKGKCSFITPVHGGVGPMTVASLFANLVEISQ